MIETHRILINRVTILIKKGYEMVEHHGTAGSIVDLSFSEIHAVNGGSLSAGTYLTYMAIGAVAVGVGVATGGAGLVIAGTFLGATAELLK
jgi:hypothetical protein